MSWAVCLLSLASMARAQSYPDDPILGYRPPFVQSLPVQVLISGIALTLTTILFFHLVFTAQYHWPLARANYALQITGVITLLISITATIYVVFTATIRQSQHWPYMLSYLAADMPSTAGHSLNSTDPILLHQPLWTLAESTTWTVMNVTTSVVVQITHIHFLTLLYPSNLEARLVFGLLGPLAVISAVMQLLPLVYDSGVANIAEDTSNVCNAALSLLFTSSLLLWGFYVNRRQAWRTDGGTAAFGVGAILLALISTSLNFLYIHRQDQFTWMPSLMWPVTLWQSFLSWWWWVGAGMGVREVEELLLRENKRQRKRLLRAQRREEQRKKAKSMWMGVTGAFKSDAKADASAADASHASSLDGSSVSTEVVLISALMHPVQLFQRWFARLRHAHLTAAHVQATERAERMHHVYQREEERYADRPHRQPIVGWGLGSFSTREVDRGRREAAEMKVRVPHAEDEEGWRDMSMAEDLVPDVHPQHSGADHLPAPQTQQKQESAGSSLWWRGPLRQWRFKDSTTYR